MGSDQRWWWVGLIINKQIINGNVYFTAYLDDDSVSTITDAVTYPRHWVKSIIQTMKTLVTIKLFTVSATTCTYLRVPTYSFYVISLHLIKIKLGKECTLHN